MYTNSKIFSMVSKSSFVFLLLILVSSSSTIAPSVNSNNISNAYGQSENGGNSNTVATASAQVGDQIQPLGNNLQNAKTLSLDSRLTLSPSQDSNVEKNNPNLNLNPNNQNQNLNPNNQNQNLNSANTNPSAFANTNNNPSLPDLSFKSPSQDSKVEKNTNNNPSLPDLSFKSSRPADLTVKTYTEGFTGGRSFDICLKYRQEVDTQHHLFMTTDAAPPCAKGSLSGFTYTIQAPSTTKVDVVQGYNFNVKTDCNLFLNPGESKTCFVYIHPYSY